MDAEFFLRLAAPFRAEEVRWKPQTVKGNRALAVAYIDARLVMRRLDMIVGPANWQTSYEQLANGAIMCSLSLRIDGEWLTKADVGGQSEQSDDGDKTKAAFSDSLKRAAVQWGIGRYLYRLPLQWCDYDPQKKQLVRTPKLPDWALPGAKKPAPQTPAPSTVPATQTQQQTKVETAPVPAPVPAQSSANGPVISWGEAKQLVHLLDETNTPEEGFCQHYGIESVSQLPRTRYDEALAMLTKRCNLMKAKRAQEEAIAASRN